MKHVPIYKINENQYDDYLRDESRALGVAESISFPQTTEELSHIMAKMHESRNPVTVQGARTGLSSGATPTNGGHIINLSRMNKISDFHMDTDKNLAHIDVEAGVVLKDLRLAIKSQGIKARDFFFPPDPTETTATIGGMISCNASGACSYLYQSTRHYIEGLTIVLASGDIIKINRGDYIFDGPRGDFTIGSHKIAIKRPDYESNLPKNVAGYYSMEDMDLIDLFIGAEGTLGIITEARLRLIPVPKEIWGIAFFFKEQANAIDFVEKIRDRGQTFDGVKVAAIEFINHRALELINRFKKTTTSFKQIPHIDNNANSAVYIEFHGSREDLIEEGLFEVMEDLVACGGDEEATWVASDEKQMDQIKLFRHAVPEAANNLIDEYRIKNPDITTLCTDMAVNTGHLQDMLKMYQDDMEKSKMAYIIYGHIGNNHLHVNMLPQSSEEYKRGMKIYNKWAKQISKWGGTVSAEHGIGKQKTNMLSYMYSKSQIEQMKAIKGVFDPHWLLNSGNIFGQP